MSQCGLPFALNTLTASLSAVPSRQRTTERPLGKYGCGGASVHGNIGSIGNLGLTWLAGASAALLRSLLGRGVKCASSRTELLVDADCYSIDSIKQAISHLEAAGRQVRTTVFAPRDRIENKAWRQFLQEKNISLEAVSRGGNYSQDPNDEAIIRAMRTLSHAARGQVDGIALLTKDTDFLDILLQLQRAGVDALVVIRSTKPGAISTYANAGV